MRVVCLADRVVCFLCRAAQKLNLTSSPHRRKRHSSGEDDAGTGFSAAIRRSPPPVPPALLRRIGVKEVTGVGKVSSHILSYTVCQYFVDLSGLG
jgi:kinesin family protein 26